MQCSARTALEVLNAWPKVRDSSPHDDARGDSRRIRLARARPGRAQFRGSRALDGAEGLGPRSTRMGSKLSDMHQVSNQFCAACVAAGGRGGDVDVVPRASRA